MSTPVDLVEQRVLILAPQRQDAPTLATILRKAGIVPEICSRVADLCQALAAGAGAVLVAEEALRTPEARGALLACLAKQPPWSDLPVLLLIAGGGARHMVKDDIEPFVGFGNMMLLERPLRSATLVTALRSALKARRRQYQVRDHLREREDANERLEQRVLERTAELEEANQRLVAEMEHRQEAERALRQAQKMEAIGQLTGGIAHDFNNLLMAISAGVDLLERSNEPGRRDIVMEGMRQAVSRGAAVTRQLLAFSRRMTLSPQPLRLRDLLEGMRFLITGALREDIALHISLPDDLWQIMADATQLELAILNLAANARDAMPTGGSLTIEAANAVLDGSGESGLAGEYVRLDIRDTGNGIPPDIVERVFEPFFTTKEIGKGTGLGLSQVYGFAKQSGGHARIASHPGEGTSIVLHLPRSLDAIESLPRRAPGPAARSGRRLRTVLLVEDNDEVAGLTGQMLDAVGASVERAANACEALAALENGRGFDLMLSDIVMPGDMNGVDLAREVRRRHPNLPIILATGYSAAVREVDPSDGFRLLLKPFRMSDLESVMDEITAGPDGRAA